jgi:hypothetical protein
LHKVFGFWSKSKLRVKSSQVCGAVFFGQRFLSAGRLPNKACTRQVGVCAIYKQFSRFKFSLLPSSIIRPPTCG